MLAILIIAGCHSAPDSPTDGQVSDGPSAVVSLELIAGGVGGPGSLDASGTAARFNFPNAVAVDSMGNVYVADYYNDTIRMITAAGVVTTLAGRPGSPGSSDGSGAAARFSFPAGVAVDAAGNVFVTDYGNETIRKVTHGGAVTTVAGVAGVGGSNDGGGTSARFHGPNGIAIDSSGNLYVTELLNQTVRKISPNGVVSTLAGSAALSGSADGTGATARFSYPGGVAVDSGGNLIVADSGNQTLRKVTPAGNVTTLAGLAGMPGDTNGTGSAARFSYPSGVAIGSADTIFVADGGNTEIREVTPQGAVSRLTGMSGLAGSADGDANTARFAGPSGIAIDTSGRLFVADAANHAIRAVSATGDVVTLAGASGVGIDDGPGADARFRFTNGIAKTSDGTLWVVDSGNSTIRRIASDKTVTTFAGLAGARGSTDANGAAARFDSPVGLATDPNGDLFVTDRDDSTIRKISPDAEVTTFAGRLNFYGDVDGAGTQAIFGGPTGLTSDTNGTLFVSDGEGLRAGVIRQITSTAVVTTLARDVPVTAQFIVPRGICVDNAGNLFVVDYEQSTVRELAHDGTLRVIAGNATTTGFADGQGTMALFDHPQGIAVDASGILYVADTGNGAIRKITPDGIVTTIIGGSGTKAIVLGTTPSLGAPRFLLVDGDSLDITDTNAVLKLRGVVR